MAQPAGHVAIIMDGNGRWAQQRGLPRLAGTTRGQKEFVRSFKPVRNLGLSI